MSSRRLPPGVLALWRAEREVQLGTDPRHAVVLGDLTPAQHRLLEELERVGTPALARMDPVLALGRRLAVPAPEARAVRDHLRAAHLEPATWDTAGGMSTQPATPWQFRHLAHRAGLADHPEEVARRRAASTVLLLGGGAVALLIARLVTCAGVGGVVLEDSGEVTGRDVLPGAYRVGDVGRPRSEVAPGYLRQSAPRVRTSAPQSLDVVVSVESRVAVPFRTSALMAGDVPHLSVVARELDVVVGPSVRPGLDPCLRCLDLHRCDADDCWPALATQLAVAPRPQHEAATWHLAAAHAAQEVLALLAERPRLGGRTLEVDGVDLTRARIWAPHPQCGCGAQEREPARSPESLPGDGTG